MPCTPLFLFPPYRPHHHPIAPTAQCGKTALIIGLHQRRDAKKTAIVIGLRKRRDAEKTAEERFNMLARGWLAYPVTSIHAHLPPKSGCRNHIPRLANNLYNRSSAVDSLIPNHPQVGKPTWGYNYTTALRRLPSAHRPPPPKTPSAHRPPSPKPAHHHRFAQTAQCEKNRRRAVSYVSTGLACLPRDANARTTTAEERL